MLNLDVWLHQQLREQLWKGPAAVSACLSVAMQLVGVTLSALFLKALTGPSLYVLSVSGLLCLLLAWADRLKPQSDTGLVVERCFTLIKTRLSMPFGSSITFPWRTRRK
jgi:hypothetical protein